MPNADFKGFRALVTGASGGIGNALIVELLNQGARVGLHYFENKPDINKLQAKAKVDIRKNTLLLKADLRKIKEVDQIFESFIDWASGIDGLVNNAGDVYKRKHFLEVSEKDIEADLALNLKAPFWLSRLAIGNMKKNNVKGSIVNISSVAAKFGGSPNSLFYGLSKSSLELMTFSLARYYCAPLGIRINSLRLGVFDTQFHKRHPKDMKKRIELIPAKRMGRPKEAVFWIMCLLDERSTYMNGQVICLTGAE